MNFDFSNLVTGAASLIGGFLNASSAARANREQSEMFDKSLAFQKYQYEDQKRYNSAMAQVSRLRQAGLNPPMTFGEGSAGAVSSVSSPSPASQHPVDFSGVLNAAASLGQGFYKAALDKSAINANNANAFKFKAEGLNTLIDNLNKADKDRADIYRMLKQGKLSESQANSEIAKLSPAIGLMQSEMDLNRQRQLLTEQELKTEFEKTAQEEIMKKIMDLRLSREPEKLQSELDFIAAQSFNQYAQGFLARANKDSIDQLTPLQKEKLSQEYFESFSRELVNKQNVEYLKKKGELIDVQKWPQVAATIAGGVASGVLASVGLGKFVKGLKGVKVVKGFTGK